MHPLVRNFSPSPALAAIGRAECSFNFNLASYIVLYIYLYTVCCINVFYISCVIYLHRSVGVDMFSTKHAKFNASPPTMGNRDCLAFSYRGTIYKE